MKNESLYNSKELFYNKNIIKFITVGRLHEVKGHKYLIDAFYDVKKQIYNSKLIIIGEGPLRRKLEQKIKELNVKYNKIVVMDFEIDKFSKLKDSFSPKVVDIIVKMVANTLVSNMHSYDFLLRIMPELSFFRISSNLHQILPFIFIRNILDTRRFLHIIFQNFLQKPDFKIQIKNLL